MQEASWWWFLNCSVAPQIFYVKIYLFVAVNAKTTPINHFRRRFSANWTAGAANSWWNTVYQRLKCFGNISAHPTGRVGDFLH